MIVELIIQPIVEFIIQPIAELVLQVAGYVTAIVVVPVLSLGRAYVEPAPKGVTVVPRWHGFSRDSNGKIAVDCELGSLLGLLFWACVVVASSVVYCHAGA